MQFSALKTSLADRGFEHLSDTRLGEYINQGRAELDNSALWPYRVTSTSGSSPVTISDLGVIEEVVDTATNGLLTWMDRRDLRAAYGDLTTTGSPEFFYIDNGVVRTFPVGGTLSIRYFKRTPMLSSASDTPLAPEDYHQLYVDMAARWAYKDTDEAPPWLAADIDRQLALMVNDLLGGQQIANPGYIATEAGNY